MKKRLFSILLAFVLAFSFVSPALAEDVSTPAADVEFFSLVGEGGTLKIEASFVVEDYHYEQSTEYPSLYILEDGVLSLLYSFTSGDFFYSQIRHTDANGNLLPWHAYFRLLFAEEEYLAFDFTADYVFKIPAGIYDDENGNPIGDQCVTFCGSDIQNDRNELTIFGRYFDKFDNNLRTLCQGTFLANLIYVPFLNVTNYVFGILNITLIQPVTVG